MKRSIFISILFLLLFGTKGNGQINVLEQRVTFMVYQKELASALSALSKETHINIAFSKEDLPEKIVSVNAENLSIEEILDYFLQASKLVYEVVDYTIVVYKKEYYDKEKFTITGRIFDRSSGELLLYADIYLKDYSQGGSSNEYGYYTLNLKRGTIDLVCSYLGYIPFEKTFRLDQDQRLNIYLDKDQRVILDEVVITDRKIDKNRPIDFFKPEQIEIEELHNMVALGGEDDILRLLYAKAGILTGADGFGGMHVRGGNSDQNQLLLDGVQIYNAEHAIGLYSVFNSEVIKTTRFLKNAFPARYGGNLSSVLDIRTRDGNKSSHHGGFNLGLFTIKAGLEGPIVKDRSSYLLSFRRTYADIWINSLREYLNTREGSSGQTAYYNYDINAKLHHQVNENNDFYLTYYQGKDAYDYSYEFEDFIDTDGVLKRQEFRDNRTGWDNKVMALKWNYNSDGGLFLKNSLIYSDYDMNNFVLDWVSERKNNELTAYRFSERMFDSAIRDLGYKFDLDFALSPESRLRTGVKILNHQFSPDVKILDNLNFESIQSAEELPLYEELKEETEPFNQSSWENRLYFESEMEFAGHTKMNIGLHLAHFYMDEDHYWSLEPRFQLHKKLTEKSVFSLSGGIMSQFSHEVNSKGLGFPSQVWLPSTSQLRPQKSWQFALGLDVEALKSTHLFFQAFYKDMDNLVMANAGEYLEVSSEKNWESSLARGIGFSYGLEAGMNYSSSSINAEVNYSFLNSKRKFNEINGGEIFDHRFSRKHMINLSYNQEISKSVDFTISWTYGTGNPFTFPTQIASFIEGETTVTKFVYDELNNFIIPDYHRLDFEFNIHNRFEWGKQKISLGAYNLYNRKNPFYISYNNKSNNINEINNTSFSYVYVFPLIPVLNYSISF